MTKRSPTTVTIRPKAIIGILIKVEFIFKIEK
jgi:hypothetical protein